MQVVKGKAPKEMTTRGLKLRIPGFSTRKHLQARSAVISSPFERNSRDEPVHLFLHMMNFKGESKKEGPRLEGVDEDEGDLSRSLRDLSKPIDTPNAACSSASQPAEPTA